MFENGAEIITATIAGVSIFINIAGLIYIKGAGWVTATTCKLLRQGCEVFHQKMEEVDEHTEKINILEAKMEQTSSVVVVTELKGRIEQLTTDISTIRRDYVEGAKDRRSIRDNMEKIAAHIKNTNNAIRVYMRMAKNGGANQDALDELLKIFEGDD